MYVMNVTDALFGSVTVPSWTWSQGLSARRLGYPVSRNTVMPAFGIQGNALVVLEQDDDGVNDAATTIKRCTIDDKACKWKKLD